MYEFDVEYETREPGAIGEFGLTRLRVAVPTDSTRAATVAAMDELHRRGLETRFPANCRRVEPEGQR